MSPLLNSPLSRGELTAGFVPRILYRGSSLKFTTFFSSNSRYFRNALVRANYNNYSKGISATASFLELFFRNLLFGEKNELHNRALHIAALQSANNDDSKSQNDTLSCTLEEIALLKFLKDNPDATQTEIAVHIGKSPRTVKRMTPSLIERGLLERENGKRNGKWVVKNINLNR